MCGWIFGPINSKLLSLTSFRRKRGEQWCVSGVKEDQLCRDGGRRGLCTVAGHVIPHTNTHQHTLTHLTQCWELNVDEWSLLDLIYNYTTHALLHVTQNYKKYICRELRAQGCFISFSFFFLKIDMPSCMTLLHLTWSHCIPPIRHPVKIMAPLCICIVSA